MKKLIALLLYATLLLCGCAKADPAVPGTVPSIPATEETTLPTETEPMAASELEAFRRVLEGSRTFVENFSGEYWNISRIGQTITTEDIPCSVRQFAVVDLDGDGIREMVLWLKLGQDEYAGFEVLRHQDGEVYGYPFSYRSILELKEDGTFRISGGAACSGIGTVQFAEGSAFVSPIAERQEEFREDGTSEIQWLINRMPVTEEEFQQLDEAQNAKSNATWYESWEAFLTDKNA